MEDKKAVSEPTLGTDDIKEYKIAVKENYDEVGISKYYPVAINFNNNTIPAWVDGDAKLILIINEYHEKSLRSAMNEYKKQKKNGE
jgi:hypothetical protein